jgi:CRISPR-associated endoribonuclease Cas6
MLPISKLSARLTFPGPVTFPYWMGNTFRGGTGIYLRNACCPSLDKNCYSCEISSECIFYFTHMKKDSKVGYGAPPKPIVLVPPFFGKSFTIEKEGYLDVNILLFGKFIRYLPHAILGLSMLGQNGIGSERRYGVNKFNIAEIKCALSGQRVYDGNTISVEAMKVIDIMDYANGHDVPDDHVSIGFETPMVMKTGTFPPTLDRLIDMVRQRLILYVNEYGDGTKIPEFQCTAHTKSSTMHFHRLKRASQRAGKGEIHAYTGTALYKINNIDEEAKRLLKIGELIGAGPKPSFGLGFYSITM